MPILTDRRTVGIAAKVDNVLANKLGRVLQRDSKVTIGITGELIQLTATVIIGGENLIDDQEVDNTNAGVRNPEDVLVSDFFARGDEIIVKLHNANAATNDARTKVFIEPI